MHTPPVSVHSVLHSAPRTRASCLPEVIYFQNWYKIIEVCCEQIIFSLCHSRSSSATHFSQSTADREPETVSLGSTVHVLCLPDLGGYFLVVVDFILLFDLG